MAYQLPEQYRTTAGRIPKPVAAALSQAELLARCQYIDHLEKQAFALEERSTMLGYLELARKVAAALAPAQLAAELDTLGSGVEVGAPELARAYSQARSELTTQNPQPPAELVKAAERTVAEATPTRSRYTRTRSGAVQQEPTMLFKNGS